jgi:hypothetical protein
MATGNRGYLAEKKKSEKKSFFPKNEYLLYFFEKRKQMPKCIIDTNLLLSKNSETFFTFNSAVEVQIPNCFQIHF